MFYYSILSVLGVTSLILLSKIFHFSDFIGKDEIMQEDKYCTCPQEYLTGDWPSFYTEIKLAYKFKEGLSQSKKEALYTEQCNYLNPFMKFYQYLLDNDLIDLVEE